MKNYLSLGFGLLLICGSSLASAQTFPYCNSASADPDGDGWGWENNQSCRMPATCASSSSDPDGDGWGWENNQSCKVAAASNTFPNCASAASDPDGDGWGWENNRSCKVVSTGTTFPNCASASSDSDGDGWGWENNRSCKVVTTRISRIMPLGDSITGSPGCWRAILWNDLATYGYRNLNFVGTLQAQYCGLQHDADNEGHGGYLATNIANNNLLPGWLQNTNPDLVLMHLGTNDVWSNVSTQNILNAYTKLVGQMRAKNPRVTVLVAKILPMNPNGCGACAQRVINLNNAIPNWANGLSTSQSPIKVVDQWSGFNTNSDTTDGVHPNDSGNYKIARNWLNAMTSVLTY